MSVAPASESVFAEFPARVYLEKYYRHVGPENDALLRSIVDYVSSRKLQPDTVIEVAGGPCLYSMLALAALRGAPFEHVTFTDIGWRNLREVETWLRDDPSQFGYAGLWEWLVAETEADPARVAANLRASQFELAEFDWRDPVPGRWHGAYDLIASHFFAESATDDETEFTAFLAKLARLGRPGATLLMSCMTRSAGYRLGTREFPAFGVDAESILAYMTRAGIELADIQISEVAAEDPESHPGYDGLFFIAGRICR